MKSSYGLTNAQEADLSDTIRTATAHAKGLAKDVMIELSNGPATVSELAILLHWPADNVRAALCMARYRPADQRAEPEENGKPLWVRV